MRLEKAIAQELLQYANVRRSREYALWLKMPASAIGAQYEAQRMRVAAWAEACNALYAASNQQQEAKSAV